MAQTTPTRRSARGRIPSKKFSDDVVEDLTILASDDDVPSNAPVPVDDDDSADEDFVEDAAPEASELDEVLDVDDSDGSAIATPGELDGPRASEKGKKGKNKAEGKSDLLRRRKSGPPCRPPVEEGTHSRGIKIPSKLNSRDERIRFLVGTDQTDVTNFAKARNIWAQDILLPRRRTLGRHPLYSDEKVHAEINDGWDWYFRRGGAEVMKTKQNLEVLDQADAAITYTQSPHPSRKLLIGPITKQKIFEIGHLQTLSICEAWNANSQSVSVRQRGKAHIKDRNGWIINVGARVLCLDWAPQHDEDVQYLAISTVQEPSLRERRSPLVPSVDYPAGVQIWAFSSITAADGQVHMNQEQEPRLVHVICADWGSIRDFKWNPAARPKSNVRDKIFVGLLAGVWSDGNLRVLDVYIDRDPPNRNQAYGTSIEPNPLQKLT